VSPAVPEVEVIGMTMVSEHFLYFLKFFCICLGFFPPLLLFLLSLLFYTFCQLALVIKPAQSTHQQYPSLSPNHFPSHPSNSPYDSPTFPSLPPPSAISNGNGYTTISPSNSPTFGPSAELQQHGYGSPYQQHGSPVPYMGGSPYQHQQSLSPYHHSSHSDSPPDSTGNDFELSLPSVPPMGQDMTPTKRATLA
jgi:hypothetical protein